MALRVLLVDESERRAAVLETALVAAGYRVAARVHTTQDLQAQVSRIQPDVIIVDWASPDRDTLGHICAVSRDQPRPVVMFTHDGDGDKIRVAIRAGVSAYVVRGLESERIGPVIDVAVARFDEFQELRRERDEANRVLAERKVIERAKGIVMRQRACPEELAFHALRKMAMDRGMRLGAVAQTIVTAEEMLAKS